MASTLRETLQAALELIQVYGAGEKLGSADAARGVQIANSILEEWSMDSLACYAMRELTVSLKVDQSIYTYGPASERATYTDIYSSAGLNVFGTGLVILTGTTFTPPQQAVADIMKFVVSSGGVAQAFQGTTLGYPELAVGALVYLSSAQWVSGRVQQPGDLVMRVTGAPVVPPKPFVTNANQILTVDYPVEWVSGSTRHVTGSWSQAKYLYQYVDVYSDYPERPTGLMGGPNSAYITDSNGTRFPVQLVDLGTWNQIANTKIIKSNIPTTAYYRANYPSSEVWLYPTPTNDTYTFTIQAYNNFDASKLDDEIALPPGYAKAMLYALGKELWPFYRQGDVPPAVVAGANDSLAALKRINKQDLQANYDKQLLRRPNATYNIYRDNTR